MSAFPPRLRALIIASLAALCAVGAATAVGGSSITLTVENNLPTRGVAGYPQVSILEPEAGGVYCWYSSDLAYFNRENNAVSPGTSKRFYTETRQSGSCLTDYDGPRLNLGVFVRLAPGRDWLRVKTEEGNNLRLRFEKQPDICNWNNNLDYCFVLRDSLGTFSIPSSQLPGLLCWSVRSSADNNTLRNQTASMTITVRGDAFCNTPRGRSVFPSKGGDPVYRDLPAPEGKFPRRSSGRATDAPRRIAQADPPKPTPDDPGQDEGTIVSFMSSAGVACEMLGLGDEKACSEVAKNENSNLANLSTDVRKFKITGSFGTVNERKNICSSTQTIPPNAGTGTVKCGEQVTVSKTETTTTTHGWKVGGSYKNSFEWKSPDAAKIIAGEASFKHEITISAEYSGSKATANSRTDTTSKTVEVTQTALAGMVTKLDVFTQSADANYSFDADLSMGLAGAAEEVKSPASLALGQSTSDIQHCLASVVGSAGVNGSIMERQKRMMDAGLTPDDPTLKRSHQLFLKSAPFYSAGNDTCPGMPTMFPSTAAFKGQGVGTYASTGYGDDGKPLETWTVCVYTMPLPSSGASERGAPRTQRQQQAPSSPCVQQKQGTADVRVPRPGVLVDLRDDNPSGAAAFTGTRASEQAIGTGRDDVINLNAGLAQVVRSGAGNDTVTALAGNDTVYAGPGDDVVRAGPHDYVEGGPGEDVLTAGPGNNVQLLGGAGSDSLSATGATGSVLAGGAGGDRLAVTGRLAGVAMGGGPGSDTYVISGTTGPGPRLFEMPGQGYDTIETDRSVRVPRYFEEVRATGGAHVNITAGGGRQVVVGNDAPNAIAPGRDPDVVDAGAGSDAIMLGWDAPDTVRGGLGADLFVPLGTPATARNGQLVPGARSHDIIDFAPADGDRIALRARTFGRQVAQLRRSWKVVVGTAPRSTAPGATMLADSSSGLLAFDRDGSGPVIPKVIAMVPDASGVAPSWFTFG